MRRHKEMFKKVDSIINTRQFRRALFKVFSSYIERHQKLLEYIADVDNFFSNYFIMKMAMYVAYSVLVLYLAFLVSTITLN